MCVCDDLTFRWKHVTAFHAHYGDYSNCTDCFQSVCAVIQVRVPTMTGSDDKF